MKQTKENNYLNLNYQEYKKKYCKRALIGFFMGVSDAIPGYSGGTTLSLLDFYEKLILRLKLVFKKNNFKNWLLNVIWLLPLIIFWIGSIFVSSFVTEILVDVGLVVPLVLLFFSFALFCIPNFFYQNIWKNNCCFFYPRVSNGKFNTNLISFFWFLVGIIIVASISALIFISGGIQLNSVSQDNIRIIFSIQWLWLCLTAFLAGLCMLIPGISGDSIFYLTNFYDDVFWNILQHPVDNILLLILVFVCVALGLVASILLSSYFLRKFKKYFLNFGLGLVCVSPLAILAGLFGNPEYLNLFLKMFLNEYSNLMISIVSLFLGLFLNLWLLISIKREKKFFQFEKESIFIIDSNFYSKSQRFFSKEKIIIKKAIQSESQIYLYVGQNQMLKYSSLVYKKKKIISFSDFILKLNIEQRVYLSTKNLINLDSAILYKEIFYLKH